MSTPLLRLPSLGLLRGFVAVGRRRSITLAAEDLCLTQSAISRQVQALEASLGVKLLVRRHRSIALTADGERLFRAADGALQQLQDVMGTIGASAARPPVTISANVSLSGLWLLPRLDALQRRHPDIDIRIATTDRLVDLALEGIDIAIRYCAAAAAPSGAIHLFDETVAPVAHPSMRHLALDSAKALAMQPLLEFDIPRYPYLQWSGWWRHMNWPATKFRRLLRFNHYDQLIHATVAGQGIALGRLELVEAMLSDGRLVRLDAPCGPLRSDHGFWLIRQQADPRPDVLKVISVLTGSS